MADEKNATPGGGGVDEPSKEDLQCEMIRNFADSGFALDEEARKVTRNFFGALMLAPSAEAARFPEWQNQIETVQKKLKELAEQCAAAPPLGRILTAAIERAKQSAMLPLGETVCGCKTCRALAAQDVRDTRAAKQREADELNDAVETALKEAQAGLADLRTDAEAESRAEITASLKDLR